MKKLSMILATAACAAAMTATAAPTSYLYWMVDVSDKSDYAFSYATVKATDSNGSTSGFLSLYGSGSTTSVGDKLASSTYPTAGTTTGNIFAGVDGYGSGSSFLFELWADGAANESKASRVAWGTVSYAALSGSISSAMSTSGDKLYTVTGSQLIPEPSSGLLALLGLAALALRRKPETPKSKV